MDRSLDETIAEHQRLNHRARRPPPSRQNYPRDGVRKSTRDDRTNLENDWVHDRFDGDDPNARFGSSRPRTRNRNSSRREEHDDRRIVGPEENISGARIRVENLHYDITEDELYDLFERIAPVDSVKLTYDRAGRSNGTAFVVYSHVADARNAIRDFDGANAKGQPIRLDLLPSSASAGGWSEAKARRDNPFDRVENRRSLFDRVQAPSSRDRRARSASPGGYNAQDGRRDARDGGGRDFTSRARRSDVTKPAPDGIDRYVPGGNRGSGGPYGNRRGPEGREGGRRPGERRERAAEGRNGVDSDSYRVVNGRPRKTQQELDAEMEDYWGGATTTATTATTTVTSAAQVTAVGGGADDDIDMIE